MNHVLEVIKTVTDLLVDADYEAIERMTDGRRLTAEQIEKAVLDYGNTLVPVPSEGLDQVNVYPFNSDPSSCRADVDLWTEEEGRSDLTLEVMLESRDDGGHDVSVMNLHVL